MTFNEIIKLIDEKDPKGWEALFLQYGQKFYGFSINNWKFNEDEAWDVVYQTLETVILKISDYEIETQAHFDNLIFKIFTNFLRQYYRKKKRVAEDFQLVFLEGTELANLDEFKEDDFLFDKRFFESYYETEEINNPKLEQLEIALNKLEQSDRDLLLLKANEFTYDQIAKMLNIENNQLKVKHFRAKQKLLRFLQTIKT